MPRLERLYALVQLGALSAGTARGIREDALAPCPFQRGNLQRRVLVIRRDAGIADFHAVIFGLNYRTRKPLFSQTCVFARKTILYRTIGLGSPQAFTVWR